MALNFGLEKGPMIYREVGWYELRSLVDFARTDSVEGDTWEAFALEICRVRLGMNDGLVVLCDRLLLVLDEAVLREAVRSCIATTGSTSPRWYISTMRRVALATSQQRFGG
eukprot:symbB.v1.2.034408.t1/scaffold4436.1/size39690/2